MDDYFLSIKNHVEIIEYIQKSKFISQVFPINSEDEALNIISTVKKKYYKATHNVYSYILGKNQKIQKCTDDGEPSGTAGIPILEIIKKENLNNTLIIVTRYFGGIKLGAGGLIRAYAHMAKIGIENSEVIKNVLCEKIQIAVDYTYWGKLENDCNNHEFKMHKIEFLDKVYIIFYLQEFQKNDFYKLIRDITNGDVSIKIFGYEYISMTLK